MDLHSFVRYDVDEYYATVVAELNGDGTEDKEVLLVNSTKNGLQRHLNN